MTLAAAQTFRLISRLFGKSSEDFGKATGGGLCLPPVTVLILFFSPGYVIIFLILRRLELLEKEMGKHETKNGASSGFAGHSAAVFGLFVHGA